MNVGTGGVLMDEIWRDLARVAARGLDIRGLFAADAGRFAGFSAVCDGLLLDFSKTALNAEALGLLLRLARAAGVEARRDAMFAGEKINITEARAVLHTALRDPDGPALEVDKVDVRPGIRRTLAEFCAFAEAVRADRTITDVINIGIGGSDLGPAMATLALAPYHDGPRVHFVSNVDAAHLADTIKTLEPARTLIIIASKTFTTVETMTNAHSARAWIAGALGEAAVGTHFAAVSTALEKVAAFGIPPDRVFGFWDWVGGRYSIWSSIGLPVAMAVGAAQFRAFLEGGRRMDEHFCSAPLERNLPVLLALVGIWHRDICGYPARAVLPYDQRLARLPAYLQQLDMESNGKSVTAEGKVVARPTGPLVFGEPGTNGQHAFYQLLHQGTDIIPCEFLVAAAGHEAGMEAHHELLIANCLAQSEALMQGRRTGVPPERIFPGNRPSVTIAYPKLTPGMLGRLIALYEHRVFCEAAVWGINAFDQWGVELGKELANALLPAVKGQQGEQDAARHDGSTAGLLAFLAPK
jgi:glucose-6-phosphate isomerase